MEFSATVLTGSVAIGGYNKDIEHRVGIVVYYINFLDIWLSSLVSGGFRGCSG